MRGKIGSGFRDVISFKRLQCFRKGSQYYKLALFTDSSMLLLVSCEETADDPGENPIPEEESQLTCTDGVDCSLNRVGRSKLKSALETGCKKVSGNADICDLFLGKKRNLVRAASADSDTSWRRGDFVNPLNQRFARTACTNLGNPFCRGQGREKRKFEPKKTLTAPGSKSGGKSDDTSKEKCDPLEDLSCFGKRSVSRLGHFSLRN